MLQGFVRTKIPPSQLDLNRPVDSLHSIGYQSNSDKACTQNIVKQNSSCTNRNKHTIIASVSTSDVQSILSPSSWFDWDIHVDPAISIQNKIENVDSRYQSTTDKVFTQKNEIHLDGGSVSDCDSSSTSATFVHAKPQQETAKSSV